MSTGTMVRDRERGRERERERKGKRDEKKLRGKGGHKVSRDPAREDKAITNDS